MAGNATLSVRKPAKAEAAEGQGGGKRVKPASLQDTFLNLMRKNKTPLTVFLVKGVKLQGIVTWFDNFSILLRRDGATQLVYKHAISTIMPAHAMDAETSFPSVGTASGRLLQDVFLTKVAEARVGVTMFLVNGVMLQGRIASFDPFCVLLERDSFVQLAYKHAISTIQPNDHVDLTTAEDDPA
ncbi:RNA chaperone Hfq [Erythrobacteraceae bacterium CFH 75059]|uniref:RNA chaperone Hfq n=1 Tax=Qipengyuania thermophila TaxID=2509361 RepID=UPI00101F0A4B|nr:RNA chaperone Hfq [Qipengyuania thermophila]TCD05208.1 RNA chaperone Hfq [Erythrobacteraceae bacterium CFH 75059]